MDLDVTKTLEQTMQVEKNSRAYWQAHMEACESSKQSCMAYCRSKGIAYHRFKYWTTKLQRKSAPIKAIPVRVQAEEESPLLLCQVKLKQGHELDIYDHSVLAKILSELL